MNIYVGNLNYNIGEEDLKTLFAEYGEVSTVKIIKDHESGKAKGFAFVEMPDNDEGNNAINALNGKDLMGRAIIVNRAKRKRTGFGGGNTTPNAGGKRVFKRREE